MKKRQMICVIASDCKYGRFSAETIKGIIAQAYACNCDIAVLTTLDYLVYDYQGAHRVAEREIYKLILSDSFDGYIYCKSPSEMPQDVMDYIESLLKKTNRFVMIADGDSDARFDYTQSDDFDDFRCMAEHLITVHGCQRIYCLTGPKGVFQSEERLKGYFAAMNSHGLPYDETYYDYGDFWRNYPKIYAQKILSGALQKPDAVVCGSDIMAYSLIEALENGGIHVPGDIAVTGYDGNEMGENPNIALTTFRRDNFQLGADCMRRLYRNITGKLSRRVKRKRSGFQLGHSCGCSVLPIAPGKERRQKRVTAMFRDHIQYTDMPFTLDHAKNVDELLTSASLTAYTIYNLKYLKISLTERYLNAVEQNITDDSPFDIRETMCQVYSRNKQYYAEEDTKRISFRADDVIHYFNLRADQPHAFYLTPIHAEKHFIGIAALSFGKRLFQYDDLYASYMRYLSHGLENLMRRNAAEYARYAYSGTSIRKPEGLLWDIQQQSSENVLIVCCEMQQVRQLYGKIGGRKLFQMMHKFAQELAMHMQPEESCCLFSDRTILMLLHSDERTDALFRVCRHLCMTEPVPISLNFGKQMVCAGDIQTQADLYEAVGEAMHQIVHTYNHKTDGNTVLYQALYKVRREMEQHPELEWKIESISSQLHISKSTLQKNYKEFFGKSIIEELIGFRIRKAEKLLQTSDSPLAVIAEQCGYSSDTYFIKQSRKVTGYTPNEYREQCKR